ncbi:LysR family transcriptional regulator [Amphritea pacifica]|uniref:LysR family transcriptional regulator n=1 Tax=Amphritea pacifica TaxID=2811233 RepID=A0ABS2W3H0_9GAMM|nr:LysR family transcriptional regulator [Amphritea pacifica]MBN0986245.1 LysR family transcriptional regulator [Amphritea pacifica]MBN1008635.1 LysR family transcriptional regulator [Amphritea pacifica]
MDIRSLRCFQMVAREANFTRAAEKLHLAQPAVSMSIKRLESELGLTLFHRNERRISLTDEGERLLLHADKIVQAVADAELEMQELTGLTRGQVRVGIPSMLGSYYLPELLMGFRHSFPALQLSVVEGGTTHIRRQIEQGTLDIGIVVDQGETDELERVHLMQVETLVCVSPDHPFASQTRVSYPAFLDEELVLFKEGFFHRQVTEQLAKQYHVSPKISFETNLIPLIQSVVRHGFGISALLKPAIDDARDLIGIPFDEPLLFNLSIAWRQQSYLSQANKAFVDYLLEHSPATVAHTSNR